MYDQHIFISICNWIWAKVFVVIVIIVIRTLNILIVFDMFSFLSLLFCYILYYLSKESTITARSIQINHKMSQFLRLRKNIMIDWKISMVQCLVALLFLGAFIGNRFEITLTNLHFQSTHSESPNWDGLKCLATIV